MTGDAGSCKSICQGVGWPSPAQATPALANTPLALAAIAAKRDNAFMPGPAPLLLMLPTVAATTVNQRAKAKFARTATARRHRQYDATRFGGALSAARCPWQVSPR